MRYLGKNIEYHKSPDGEGYKFTEARKFQDNFDASSLEAFKLKIGDALTKTNLIAGGKYFPRRMFLKFLNIDEDFVYGEIKRLLDERRDLVSRINEFNTSFEKKKDEIIKKGILPEKKFNTYMDYRFLSYILASYRPEKYVYVKYSEYNHFLKKIDVEKSPGGTNGEKYEFYLKYANIVREELKKNKKYLALHEKLVEDTGYADADLSWGTQDLIFTVHNYELDAPMSPEDKKLSELLSQKSQVIFYGPPGTGKTYKAREFAVDFIEGG